MKLKQNDRELLREFFFNNSDWMRRNSLMKAENLSEFKNRFLGFVKTKGCEENLVCKLFLLSLEHEILGAEERKLIQLYNEEMTKKGLKKVKLTCYQVVPHETDNEAILEWVKESKIACEVSSAEMEKLNRSIKQKIAQNERERTLGYEEAKNFIVY